MIDESRIGECDACHARFKVPTSFRADRARCRECGGVVILERTHPVPRPPLEKSRKPKSTQRPDPSAERAADGRVGASTPAPDAREPQRAIDHVASHGTAVAPPGAPRPIVANPSVGKTLEKERAAASKEEKKSGGVLGSIVAAAKAAMWRKKRRGAKD